MLIVTEKAAGMIKDFLKQQGTGTVRIMAQPG